MRRTFLCVLGLSLSSPIACSSGTSESNPPSGGATGDDESESSSGGSGTTGEGGGSGGRASVGGSQPTGVGGSDESGDGGAAGSSDGGSPSLGGCDELTLRENVNLGSFNCDQMMWFDGACQQRSAALVRVGGGYLREYRYSLNGQTRVITGTGAAGHKGWGYTVNHFGNTATIGQDASGTFEAIFVGRHHAIYEYRSSPRIDGQAVPVTQHWFFASGRSHPVLATTYDMTDIAPDSLVADIRTPYGDLAWDGDDNAGKTVISGVGWGDRYKFITTEEPLTMNSTWDYTEQNLVPYVLEWERASDAEMGVVQTQTQIQHEGGGYWFYSNWGKTSANQTKMDGQVGNMTPTWNWTYQLNQYELCIEDASCVNSPTGSHRLAWGTNYGALGGDGQGPAGTYAAYGDDKRLPGHPYQSYSVVVVLSPHSESPTFTEVEQMERVQQTKLTASVGSVTAKLPGGVGRTDLVDLDPPGWDARYGALSLTASDEGRVSFQIETPGLRSPVFVVEGSSAEPESVVLDGTKLEDDRDYLASFDEKTGRLWVTLRKNLSEAHTLEIQ